MKILFFGDVFGKPGRRAVAQFLPRFKAENRVDLCIANCENLTDGKGASEKKIAEMQALGVALFSSGNHLWDKKEEYPFIAQCDCIAKPLNYPKAALGKDYASKTINGREVILLTLCGQSFMGSVNSPFHTLEKYLTATTAEAGVSSSAPTAEAGGGRGGANHSTLNPANSKLFIIDFHAESTAEKRTMGFYFDGRVSAILGTHTHIQTADEEILPNGTAYITDIGMCGPHDSVIGVKKEIAIERARTGMPVRHETAVTGLQVNAVYIEIDDQTGKAISIQRIKEKL